MSVFIDKSTRLIVQGLTGREGTFHAKQAQAYGTAVVGGVTPGKGGIMHEGWPVFNTVAQAVNATGANTSVIFVPAGMPHRFHDITEEVRLLVVFGPAEGSRAGR